MKAPVPKFHVSPSDQGSGLKSCHSHVFMSVGLPGLNSRLEVLPKGSIEKPVSR